MTTPNKSTMAATCKAQRQALARVFCSMLRPNPATPRRLRHTHRTSSARAVQLFHTCMRDTKRATRQARNNAGVSAKQRRAAHNGPTVRSRAASAALLRCRRKDNLWVDLRDRRSPERAPREGVRPGHSSQHALSRTHQGRLHSQRVCSAGICG